MQSVMKRYNIIHIMFLCFCIAATSWFWLWDRWRGRSESHWCSR